MAEPAAARLDPAWQLALRLYQRGSAATLVLVADSKGSVPREVGAWMVVGQSELAGTIGGGQLEHQACDKARGQQQAEIVRVPLAASAAQCCGGVVWLLFYPLHQHSAPWLEHLATAGPQALVGVRLEDSVLALAPQPSEPRRWWLRLCSEPVVLVAGAGHVGQALVGVLAALALEVWVADQRWSLPHASAYWDDPLSAIKALPSGAYVLILSHSHALDFELCVAALTRTDLGRIGLIGSTTKARLFDQRLAARGFDPATRQKLVCPLGLAAIGGKTPAEVALSIAAQVLAWMRHNPGKR